MDSPRSDFREEGIVRAWQPATSRYRSGAVVWETALRTEECARRCGRRRRDGLGHGIGHHSQDLTEGSSRRHEIETLTVSMQLQQLLGHNVPGRQCYRTTGSVE